MSPLRVILVEDDEIDAEAVRRAFRQHDLDPPLTFADGLFALEALRDERGPLRGHPRPTIILDLNLPRMNGLEFLEALRADPALRETPVVVLATSDDARDRRAARALGVAGYLIKGASSDLAPLFELLEKIAGPL